MSCNSCMIGGNKRTNIIYYGGDKIKNNIAALENYKILQLQKLFRKHNQTYDKENGKSENILLFSINVKDSENIVKEWVKKNKIHDNKKKTPITKHKTTKKDLEKKINFYQKKNNCNLNLSSNKTTLKQVADKHKLKYNLNPTIKELKKLIKEHKKNKCPKGLSKMKKTELLEIIKKYNIPMQLEFKKKLKTVQEYRETTPEKLVKEKANKIYNKLKKKYDKLDLEDLGVEGVPVTDITNLEEAHKRAVELEKYLKSQKKSKKLKKKTKKTTKSKKKTKTNEELEDKYDELYNKIYRLNDIYFGSNMAKVIKEGIKIFNIKEENINTTEHLSELILQDLPDKYNKDYYKKMKKFLNKVIELKKI